MKVLFYEDIDIYYNRIYSFLIEQEAENNLLFSILNTIKINPTRYGEDKPILIAVEKNNEIKLVSLRTPPYNQVLSYTGDLKSIDFLTDKLFQKNIELPGVIGFKNGAIRFTKLWCEKKYIKSQIIRNERIYKLKKVAEDTLGKRELFIANESNQSLILKWTRNFIVEALAETNESIIARSLEAVKDDIKNKKIFLLKDKEKVVSVARKAGKTPNGNLVNLVYTPSELRRRGYATECVAKLSKRLLEEGNKYCFLFTDLMNPISNSIYQKIGYRPVVDVIEYKFMK